MKHSPIATLGFVLILGVSCTDVIDIQPDDAPALLVVDAWLNNRAKSQIIDLSETVTYFDSQSKRDVTDASVSIQSDQGRTFVFEHQGQGSYRWQPEDSTDALGVAGHGFLLEIVRQGVRYQASSTMLPTASIEEIRQEFRENELGSADGIWAEFIARDLPGLGNTYWIKTYKNDSLLNKPEELNLAFDAAFDSGSQVDGLIFIPPIRELINPVPDPTNEGEEAPAPWSAGDKIRVEIHSVSIPAFEFMTLARDQILNGNNTIFATPIANTRGNVTAVDGSSEVLGVFNVAEISAMTAQIN